MEAIALLRMAGALAVVLALMAAALWAVRRFDLRLPGHGGAAARRLAVVERLPIDQRRALLLVRRDGREHLILVGPDGQLLVEGGIVTDAVDAEAAAARAERGAEAAADASRRAAERAATLREGFAALVAKAARRRDDDAGRGR